MLIIHKYMLTSLKTGIAYFKTVVATDSISAIGYPSRLTYMNLWHKRVTIRIHTYIYIYTFII